MSANLSMLIIDDDPDDRELFIEAVAEVNPVLNCTDINGGLEAVKLLSDPNGPLPDYIFLDMNMPLMNGKECLAELKKIKRLDRTRIVIYTTSQRVDDVTEMLASGAFAFLIKPSVFGHLKNAIHKIINPDNVDISVDGLYQA